MTYFQSIVLLLSAMTVAVAGYAVAAAVGFARRSAPRDAPATVGIETTAPYGDQEEGAAAARGRPDLALTVESDVPAQLVVQAAAPRIAIMTPLTGTTAAEYVELREAVDAVAAGLSKNGAIALNIGPIRPEREYSGLERATADRILADADAAVFIASRSNIGLGVGLASASALPIPKLVFAKTDLMPQMGAVLGNILIQPLPGVALLADAVTKWLRTALPEIREKRRQRQTTEDALAPLILGFRQRFQEISSQNWPSAAITQERARLLLSDESIFAMSSAFEIAALSAALDPTGVLPGDWPRTVAEGSHPSSKVDQDGGLAESGRVWMGWRRL